MAVWAAKEGLSVVLVNDNGHLVGILSDGLAGNLLLGVMREVGVEPELPGATEKKL